MEFKAFPEIMGYNRTSEAGFNLFAVSIFLFGCNFRCPYCMNGRIVVVKPEDWDKPVKTVDISVIKSVVEEEGASWVMISGGEPTLTPPDKLKNLIAEIKLWGCKVGISTNGTYPHLLENIISDINYVAMDLKSHSPEVYEMLDIKHKAKSFSLMLETKSMLCREAKTRDDFKYEIRTTMYPKYVTADGIDKIGGIIRNDETWVFQQYRHAKNMLLEDEAKAVTPYTEDEITLILNRAKRYTDKVVLRYV